MKKLAAIILATALLLSLAGCNFNGMFSDSTGTKEMEAKQQVTDMLEALANKDLEAALALMHPDVLADAEKKADVTEKLQQMMNYLNGRKSLAEEQQNLNVRSGNGTYVWADGTRYIGEFASDAKDGKGSLYFPDGAYYQGDFVNDTRTGKGFYKWANGDTYEGDFYRGAVTGKGTFSWSKNDERLTYTGYFENGKIVLVEEEETPPVTGEPKTAEDEEE